jgi:hypothetical protein
MWLLLLQLAAAAAQREFSTSRCEGLAGGIATPAKAIEEACQSDLGLSAGQCEFFTEAWGLAITHAGFSSADFCRNVGSALRCSGTMDAVLTSSAVKDLAFAECVREQGKDSVEYCMQFQSAIGAADHSTDLDTLRACYLMEEEVKTVAAPIVGNSTGMSAGGQGASEPPQPLQTNATASKPFGVSVSDGAVPAEPPRVTVEPMHGVRRNGSAYEEHHILQGDGPLSSAGTGTPAEKDLPAVPPPTREELAVGAATEAGALAGATAGAAAGENAGEAAGHAAGKEVGLDIAKNDTMPRESVEAAAYKAGFEAGKSAGGAVVKDVKQALVRVHASTSKPPSSVVKAIQEAAAPKQAQKAMLAKVTPTKAKTPEKATVAKAPVPPKATEAVLGKLATKAKKDAKATKATKVASVDDSKAKKDAKAEVEDPKAKKKVEDEEAIKAAPMAGFLTKFVKGE